MRVVLIAAATLVLAALGWWLASDPGSGAPDALAEAPDPVEPPTAAPVSAERNRLPEPTLPPGETTEGVAPAAEPVAPALASEPTGHLHLDVRAPDGSPLAAFRYVLVRADTSRSAERVEGHQADLPLPLGEPALLTVEAEGFEPSAELTVELTAAEPQRRLPVVLVPYAAFTGIELRVRHLDGSPIDHLEVEANATGPDPATQPRTLWRRRAQDDRGIYLLPDFKAGVSYLLRLRALTPDGEVAPLVPHEETVVFAGGREQRDITLRPGAFLTVTVLDPAGQLLGQEVNLRLVHPDGAAPLTRWRSEVRGERTDREDGLPAAAAARLVDPLPPGHYTLQARIADGPVTELAVVLSVVLAADTEPTVTIRVAR